MKITSKPYILFLSFLFSLLTLGAQAQTPDTNGFSYLEINGQWLKVRYLKTRQTFEVMWPEQSRSHLLIAKKYQEDLPTQKECGKMRKTMEILEGNLGSQELQNVMRDQVRAIKVSLPFISLNEIRKELTEKLTLLAQQQRLALANSQQPFVIRSLNPQVEIKWGKDSLSSKIGQGAIEAQIKKHDPGAMEFGYYLFELQAKDAYCDLLSGELQITVKVEMEFESRVQKTAVLNQNQIEEIYQEVRRQWKRSDLALLDKSRAEQGPEILEAKRIYNATLLGMTLQDLQVRPSLELNAVWLYRLYSILFDSKTFEVFPQHAVNYATAEDRMTDTQVTALSRPVTVSSINRVEFYE